MTTDRTAAITIAGEEYTLVLTTRATKEIAGRYGGLENLGDKLMKENMHAFRAKTFGKYFWSRVEKPEVISYDEFAAKLEEPGWLHFHE